MYCRFCGHVLREGSQFCPECGKAVQINWAEQQEKEKLGTVAEEKGFFCRKCGTRSSAGELFCGVCGTKLDNPSNGIQAEKTHLHKRMKAGGIVAAFLAVIVVGMIGAFFFVRQRTLETPYFLYMKDNELWMGNVRGEEMKRVERNVVEGEMDDGDLLPDIYDVLNGLQKSQDGSYFFYPAEIKLTPSYNIIYDLYCIEVDKKEAEPIKLASDICSYSVLKNNHILYVDKECRFCICDINGNEEEISSDYLQWYKLSIDEKTLIYVTSLGMYHVDMQTPRESEKLDLDVTAIVAASDSLDMIIYKKEGGLYVLKDLSKKEKIAEGTANVSVLNSNEDTAIIYTKGAGLWPLMMEDLVVDDMTASGSEMGEEMKDYLANTSALPYSYDDFVKADIFVYDVGTKEESIVQEGVWILPSNFCVDDTQKSAHLIRYITEEDLPKIPISEAVSDTGEVDYFALENRVEVSLKNAMSMALLKTDAFLPIDIDGRFCSQVEANEEEKQFYCLAKKGDAESCDLVRIGWEGEEAGTVETLDTEVTSLKTAKNGNVFYLKGNDDAPKELYCNGKLVDTGIADYLGESNGPSGWEIGEDGKCYYIIDGIFDFNDGTEGGTLCVFDGEEKREIAEDVLMFLPVGEEDVLFLSDYSMLEFRGELYYLEGEEANRLDSDVSWIYEPISAGTVKLDQRRWFGLWKEKIGTQTPDTDNVTETGQK